MSKKNLSKQAYNGKYSTYKTTNDSSMNFNNQVDQDLTHHEHSATRKRQQKSKGTNCNGQELHIQNCERRKMKENNP